MNWQVMFAVGGAVTAMAGSAWAWDGPGSWAAPADGKEPGAGRIHGTGGQRDYGIECKSCHIDSQGKIDATFTPTPAFENIGGQLYYEPGVKYTFSVDLLGEYLGLSGCDQYVAHTNNFAATFEDAAGTPTGVLESDTGQNQATNCPATLPMPDYGTTLLYDDCRVIVPHGSLDGATSWTFFWTAPAAGTGAVTLFAGVVDGDCVMDSLNDDVKMVKTNLADKSQLARLSPSEAPHSPRGSESGFPWSPLTATAFALGLVFVVRRKH